MNVACACDETRPWSIAKTGSHAVSAYAVDFETKLETSRGVHWQRWTPPVYAPATRLQSSRNVWVPWFCSSPGTWPYACHSRLTVNLFQVFSWLGCWSPMNMNHHRHRVSSTRMMWDFVLQTQNNRSQWNVEFLKMISYLDDWRLKLHVCFNRTWMIVCYDKQRHVLIQLILLKALFIPSFRYGIL